MFGSFQRSLFPQHRLASSTHARCISIQEHYSKLDGDCSESVCFLILVVFLRACAKHVHRFILVEVQAQDNADIVGGWFSLTATSLRYYISPAQALQPYNYDHRNSAWLSACGHRYCMKSLVTSNTSAYKQPCKRRSSQGQVCVAKAPARV